MGTLTACRGDDHLAVDNVERDLVAMAEEASAIAVKASCPGKIGSEAGTSFRCTVSTYGRRYHVRGEVTEETGTTHPWEFDEDDLHIGPATLTCAQLRADASWHGAAQQLIAREAIPTPAEALPQQVRSVRDLFIEECRDSPPGAVPYPQVSARLAGS